MRIWEKIYLVVMALFLLLLNSCNVLVFQSTYRKSVEAVEKTAVSFWKQIALSMEEDLAEIENSEEDQWQLFQSYVSSYCTQNLAFELWSGQKLQKKSEIGTQVTDTASEGELSSEFLEDDEQKKELLEYAKQTGCVTVLQRNGDKYTCVSGALSGTSYQLVIYENVSHILVAWETQMIRFVLLEIIASLLMAVFLYLIMRKFLAPISEVSAVTAKIAAGDYFCHLDVKGEDELSILAEDINYMTEQIRENIHNKEAEARQKQEFIDALSHELRTPLTSVRGYAQLVRNTVVSKEKQIEYMDYIVRESGRMVDLTETLRQMTLLRHDPVEQEKISLKQLSSKLQYLVEYQLVDKPIQWNFQVEEGTVWGNQVLMELFFMNLIRNSFHACEAGGRISAVFCPAKAVITDDGIGMSEECRKHLFEPFYREDKSRSRKLGGTGLGMYVCQCIADIHHWEIVVTSEKGKGTRVEVLFV